MLVENCGQNTDIREEGGVGLVGRTDAKWLHGSDLFVIIALSSLYGIPMNFAIYFPSKARLKYQSSSLDTAPFSALIMHFGFCLVDFSHSCKSPKWTLLSFRSNGSNHVN